MDERLRFVARLLDGEKMAAVCAEFGLSRKTGYKIYERYKDAGVVGLTDRSRRPFRQANQLPMAVEKLEDLDYLYHDWTAVITGCGRTCYQRRKINVSQVCAGQKGGGEAGRRARLARRLHALLLKVF